MLGHDNPTLLYNTYKALVTKSEAERYWKITPGYDGKTDVIVIPTSDEITEVRRKALVQALQRPEA